MSSHYGPASPEQTRPALRNAVFLLFVLLLTVLLYSPALDGPLIHDDLLHFGPNSSLKWQSLSDPAITETLDRYPSRFLGMASFGLQYIAFGDSVLAGKAINLTIHLLNGVLLFLVLIRLLSLTEEIQPAHRNLTAVAITALWMLHPLQVSTVAYTVQRLTMLSATVTLVAMLPWLAWLAWLQARRPTRPAWLAVLALSLTVPAYYFKENGALLPLLLLLFLPLTGWRPTVPEGKAKHIALAVGILAGLALLGTQLPGIWHRHFAGAYTIRDFDVTQRLMTESRVVAFYMSEIFWPLHTRMSLHLDGIAISRSLWTPWTTLPSILLVMGLGAAGLFLLMRRRLAGFGLLFFFFGHLMESTFIGLEIAYEHRNYLPSAGLLIAIAALGARLNLPRKAALTIATAIALFCIGNLALRAATWSNEETLRASMVQTHPDSSRAHLGYATQLLKQSLESPQAGHGLQALALQHLRRAASLNPSAFQALQTMAIFLPPDSSEYDAVWNEMYARARYGNGVGRELFNALQDMTQCAVNDPQCLLPAGRVEALFRASLEKPERLSWSYQTQTRRLFGTLLVRASGKPDEGLELARSVAKANCPECRVSYFRNLVAAGRSAEAREYYPRAAGDGPLPAQERRSLARALDELNRHEQADDRQ